MYKKKKKKYLPPVLMQHFFHSVCDKICMRIRKLFSTSYTDVIHSKIFYFDLFKIIYKIIINKKNKTYYIL
jgi:hypothetical protein